MTTSTVSIIKLICIVRAFTGSFATLRSGEIASASGSTQRNRLPHWAHSACCGFQTLGRLTGHPSLDHGRHPVRACGSLLKKLWILFCDGYYS
ncbi:hypothetical protein F9C07_6020 [Aspergillus flavus]|uniref:Secreted protein n=1 Tax=Aspergillus flavus (strain ATCC 200026 / FGSC A1120 / IAM 13836 / NRRL 3357 / JCM 12722 / SRRC 167) TaxID=332952 RepID=A0A7U2MY37_ASPFN|nr:hypothetical protein F9C07_6020 [Aspergillus flavus]